MTGHGDSWQRNEDDCTSGLSDMTEEVNPKPWWEELVSRGCWGEEGCREPAGLVLSLGDGGPWVGESRRKGMRSGAQPEGGRG